MFDLTVNADLDRAAGFVDAILAGLNAREFRIVAGEAAKDVLVDHFADLGRERHRGQNTVSNFWEDAADAAVLEIDDQGAQIVVDQAGVAQRRFGGLIEPVNHSHLWIPVHPDSIGRTGADFDNLLVLISPETGKGVAIQKGHHAPADRDARGRYRSRSGQDGDVLFALVESLDQEEDPSVDPDDQDLLDAATAAQLELLDRKVSRT
jgi:hypothetical protein